MKSFCFITLICKAAALALLSLTLISCSGNHEANNKNPVLKIGQGLLSVPGGKIWYNISGNANGTPLVLLHGGPGSSSFYLKPFEELGNDRQIIRYDQLGSGKSDVVTDTAMFTIEHFVKELDSLRRSFGINKWNILGHSWGTILALEYYRSYPENVASLIFASACLDIPAYADRARELLKTLPDSLQQAIIKAEAGGDFLDPLYQTAINQYTGLYLMRKPVMADVDSTISTYNGSIYYYMQGPSEFSITGTLKNYDATEYLQQIKVPTLFTVGEFDAAGPDLVRSFADNVPGSVFHLFPDAAHITIWDAKEENLQVVKDFLRSADSSNVKK